MADIGTNKSIAAFLACVFSAACLSFGLEGCKYGPCSPYNYYYFYGYYAGDCVQCIQSFMLKNCNNQQNSQADRTIYCSHYNFPFCLEFNQTSGSWAPSCTGADGEKATGFLNDGIESCDGDFRYVIEAPEKINKTMVSTSKTPTNAESLVK